MLNKRFRYMVAGNFISAYKEFLSGEEMYNDESLTDAHFQQTNPLSNLTAYDYFQRAAFVYFDLIAKFYKKHPNGTYAEEAAFVEQSESFKRAISLYEGLTKDKQLYIHLKTYSYWVQEALKDTPIFDKKGKLILGKVQKFFEKVDKGAATMHTFVRDDLANGNCWWLEDDAKTLRNIFSNNYIMISAKRCQALCDKYFTRKVDIFEEFLRGAKGNELIAELDANMKNRFGLSPVYKYWGLDENGERVLKTSLDEPTDGSYYFIEYEKAKREKVEESERL